MLPKSSAQVSEVIKLANSIAREYELEYVGTEHMLLAVLEQGSGTGASVLIDRGITPSGLRIEVEKLIKKSMEETWVFGRLPGTPHFKNVMATAIRECQHLKAKEVDTEHILLALLKEKGCIAYQALKGLGVNYEDVRESILKNPDPQ